MATPQHLEVYAIQKSDKPSPDFPLFAHNNGQWAKKIGGRTHYFAPWDDHQAALTAYRAYLKGPPNESPCRRIPSHPRSDKPAKPHPDFPLYPHASGKWARKFCSSMRMTSAWLIDQCVMGRDSRSLVERPCGRNGQNALPDVRAARTECVINAAGVQLRAMVLLGINCGLGNNDCALLPTSALNLETGWLNFLRPKTGISRECPVWSETVQVK